MAPRFQLIAHVRFRPKADVVVRDEFRLFTDAIREPANRSWAGAVLVLYGAAGVIYSRIARWLLRRFGQTGLARGGSALMCVYVGSLSVLPAWGWALPACLAGGLGFYMLHGTLQTYATQRTPHSCGTAVTLFSSCLFMGNSAGVAVAAMIVDVWSATPVFLVSALALPAIGWSFVAQARAIGVAKPAPAVCASANSSAVGCGVRFAVQRWCAWT